MRVLATRADMEGNADDFDAVLLGGGQEIAPVRARGSKLERKARGGTSVVGDDTEDELDLLGDGRTLAHFLGVIEGHQVDARTKSLDDVGTRLAGVGEDDIGLLWEVLGLLADQSDLLARSTVEVGAKKSQRLDNDGIAESSDDKGRM